LRLAMKEKKGLQDSRWRRWKHCDS